jgi:hypothetical protein
MGSLIELANNSVRGYLVPMTRAMEYDAGVL